MRQSSVWWSCQRSSRVFTVLLTAQHNGRAARIKELCCVVLSGWTASCGMCGSQRSQRCKAKWTYSATTAEAGVQVEHRLNLARSHETDRENDYENRSLVFSYERCHNVKMESWVPYYSVPYLLLKWKYVMPVVFSSQKPIDIASPAAAQQK